MANLLSLADGMSMCVPRHTLKNTINIYWRHKGQGLISASNMQQSQCLCAINDCASLSLTTRFIEVELRSTDTSTVLTVFLLSFLTSDRISKRKLHNSLLNLRGPSSKVTKQLAVFLQRVEQFLALHTSRIFFPLTINFLYPH